MLYHICYIISGDLKAPTSSFGEPVGQVVSKKPLFCKGDDMPKPNRMIVFFVVLQLCKPLLVHERNLTTLWTPIWQPLQ